MKPLALPFWLCPKKLKLTCMGSFGQRPSRIAKAKGADAHFECWLPAFIPWSRFVGLWTRTKSAWRYAQLACIIRDSSYREKWRSISRLHYHDRWADTIWCRFSLAMFVCRFSMPFVLVFPIPNRHPFIFVYVCMLGTMLKSFNASSLRVRTSTEQGVC